MSVREEVLNAVAEAGLIGPYSRLGITISGEGVPIEGLERLYQAAYLAGAKAMREEAEKVCDFIATDGEAGLCAHSIRALNLESKK